MRTWFDSEAEEEVKRRRTSKRRWRNSRILKVDSMTMILTRTELYNCLGKSFGSHANTVYIFGFSVLLIQKKFIISIFFIFIKKINKL
jgi:lysozyme family protein